MEGFLSKTEGPTPNIFFLPRNRLVICPQLMSRQYTEYVSSVLYELLINHQIDNILTKMLSRWDIYWPSLW